VNWAGGIQYHSLGIYIYFQPGGDFGRFTLGVSRLICNRCAKFSSVNLRVNGLLTGAFAAFHHSNCQGANPFMAMIKRWRKRFKTDFRQILWRFPKRGISILFFPVSAAKKTTPTDSSPVGAEGLMPNLLLRHDRLELAGSVEHAHHVQETVVVAEDQRRGYVQVPQGFGEFLGSFFVARRQRGGAERGNQTG